MYLCGRDIDFASFYDFSIGFWNVRIYILLRHKVLTLAIYILLQHKVVILVITSVMIKYGVALMANFVL
jgi:hypothetical protein